MKVVTEHIEVDMALIKKLSGKLLPDMEVEMMLVKYYKYLVNEENDPIVEFTQYLLNEMHYTKGVVYEYSNIYKFFKERRYIHIVYYILGLIEITILNKIEPGFIDIECMDLTGTIGTFKITRGSNGFKQEDCD
jgi:hypothetical protein